MTLRLIQMLDPDGRRMVAAQRDGEQSLNGSRKGKEERP
jgi:hypothetical protein